MSKIKITGFENGRPCGVYENGSNVITSSYISVKIGDCLEFIGWCNWRQSYEKVLLNGQDVTNLYNQRSAIEVERLQTWAKERRKELTKNK